MPRAAPPGRGAFRHHAATSSDRPPPRLEGPPVTEGRRRKGLVKKFLGRAGLGLPASLSALRHYPLLRRAATLLSTALHCSALPRCPLIAPLLIPPHPPPSSLFWLIGRCSAGSSTHPRAKGSKISFHAYPSPYDGEDGEGCSWCGARRVLYLVSAAFGMIWHVHAWYLAQCSRLVLGL